MLKFVRSHTPQGKCPIAGNSIHVDRMFLDKYMKKFVAHLHYRIVDVSTIKELCKYVTQASKRLYKCCIVFGHI